MANSIIQKLSTFRNSVKKVFNYSKEATMNLIDAIAGLKTADSIVPNKKCPKFRARRAVSLYSLGQVRALARHAGLGQNIKSVRPGEAGSLL